MKCWRVRQQRQRSTNCTSKFYTLFLYFSLTSQIICLYRIMKECNNNTNTPSAVAMHGKISDESFATINDKSVRISLCLSGRGCTCTAGRKEWNNESRQRIFQRSNDKTAITHTLNVFSGLFYFFILLYFILFVLVFLHSRPYFFFVGC